MTFAIRCEGLSKSYERKRTRPGLMGAVRGLFQAEVDVVSAVSGVSFSLQRGERVGLIGENGAGKSTTVKMLTGILKPTSGTLSVLGLDPFLQRRRVAARIGVVFGQRPQLLWDIPVRETFTLLKSMYGIEPKLFAATYEEAVRRLELGPLLDVAVRKLSLGQRMRCDLAAALLHAPEIAFLDEPTIGLDVSVKEQVREFVTEMQRRFGTTLLLTTHDLKDITETCERLLLLDGGKLLFDGSLPDFEKRFASARRILLELERPVEQAVVDELVRALAPLGGELIEHRGHRLVVRYQREGAAPALTQCLLTRLPVTDIVLERADIESVVANIYRRTAAPQHTVG